MLEKYFEKVPKFDGVSSISIEDHVDKVWEHMKAYGASDEDVFNRGVLTSPGKRLLEVV